MHDPLCGCIVHCPVSFEWVFQSSTIYIYFNNDNVTTTEGRDSFVKKFEYILKHPLVVIKVIIDKSCCEVSLLKQETIERVS